MNIGLNMSNIFHSSATVFTVSFIVLIFRFSVELEGLYCKLQDEDILSQRLCPSLYLAVNTVFDPGIDLKYPSQNTERRATLQGCALNIAKWPTTASRTTEWFGLQSRDA